MAQLHDGMTSQNQSASVDQKLNLPAGKLGKQLALLAETFDTHPPANDNQASNSFRKAPKDDAQLDFFVPALHDIPLKDDIGLMDVAVFRLSKRQTRKGEIIRYELPDVIIEVSGGAHGMATIDDYDIVQMMISHLTEETNRWRADKGAKPPKIFRVSAHDIFRFCRKSKGGANYNRLSGTFERLQGTIVKIDSRNTKAKTRRTGYFPLLAGVEILSRTDTGKICSIEITIPDWIYDEIVNFKKPNVLTVARAYFLIKEGLKKFVYRLARKVAGATDARYSFASLHERSGSSASLKKFSHSLRKIIKDNDLPDYWLEEIKGESGAPLLYMRHRDLLPPDNSGDED